MVGSFGGIKTEKTPFQTLQRPEMRRRRRFLTRWPKRYRDELLADLKEIPQRAACATSPFSGCPELDGSFWVFAGQQKPELMEDQRVLFGELRADPRCAKVHLVFDPEVWREKSLHPGRGAPQGDAARGPRRR